MQKRPKLNLSIHCEGPFSTEVYRRLFRLSNCYRTDIAHPLIPISIDDLDTQEEKIEIQEFMYDTVALTNLTLEITTEEALYTTLVFIINEARMYLDETGYDPYGDSLIIFAAPTKDSDTSYNFQWSFII